jgi:hypothetical protein
VRSSTAGSELGQTLQIMRLKARSPHQTLGKMRRPTTDGAFPTWPSEAAQSRTASRSMSSAC